MSDLIGRTFRSYVVTAELGRGGMAVVYLARQTSMDRLVAIKVIAATMSQEADFRARFDQEARTIARLEHPHILPVIDYGEEDFGAFLVMRYVDGGTLQDRLRRRPLSFSQAHEMLRQIASALDYAHTQGVIHRDLKPANILLDERDNPYLTDFGIAKLLQSTQKLTNTGATVGTPAYMAPEQWKSEPLGPYTDLYALGVMLYEMVTGDLPFKADTTYGYMHKHVFEQPEPPRKAMADLPEAAELVILKALSKMPASRYPTGRALSDAFGLALGLGYTPPMRLAGAFDPDATSVIAPEAADSRMAIDVASAPTRDAGSAAPRDSVLRPATTRLAASARGGRRGLWVIAALGVIALIAVAILGSSILGGVVAPTATATPSPTLPLLVAENPTLAATPSGEQPVAPTEEMFHLAPVSTAPPTDTATPSPTEIPSLTPSRTPSNTPSATWTASASPTPTATPSDTSTPTPDIEASEAAAQQATLQRVIYNLTATANAAIIALATDQAARTGTAIVIASMTATPTPTFTLTTTPTFTPTPTFTLTSTPTFTPTPTFTLTLTSTPTLTPSLTPTLTPTFTLTMTPTPTFTLTLTPTLTPSFTPLPTYTPSRTPAPTRTPRLLPTWTPLPPSATPTEGIASCPGLLPSRIRPGDTAFVNDQDPRPVNVRAGPGLSQMRIGNFPVLTRFTVLEGPVCLDGYAWFRVQGVGAGNTLVGWLAESGEGVYYVEPVGTTPVVQSCPGVLPTRLNVGMAAVVDTPSGLPLRLHDTPLSASPVTALIPDGTRVTILEGIVCADGYSWWRYQTADGFIGWSSEADNDSYFLAPAP